MILNGIFFVLRTGISRRDLPERYDSYTTTYNRFNRWAARGIWGRMFEALVAGSWDSLQLIDSTIVKAHRAAAGTKGGRNQAIGISRGGRSTKIRALVDGKGRPLHFVLTGGQAHDNQVVGHLLQAPRPALAVAADKAYESRTARQQIKDDGAVPVIPSRANARKKARCPKRIYRQRHKIENFLCRLKDWRRLATRYDKLACNFPAATSLAAALYWISP